MKTILLAVLIAAACYAQAPLVATPAECVTGTVTGKACSPEGVKAAIDAAPAGTVTSVTGTNGAIVNGTTAVTVEIDDSYVATLGGDNTHTGKRIDTPSTAQDITAATQPIVCSRVNIQITSDASYTLDPASTDPIIADGSPGQVCRITNTDASDTITLTDADSMTGSNLQLNSATVALAPGKMIELHFLNGEWREPSTFGGSSAVTSLCYWAPVTGIDSAVTSSTNQVTPCSIPAGTFQTGDTVMCRMAVYRDVVSAADTAQLSVSFVVSNASGTTMAVSGNSATLASATVAASATNTLSGTVEVSIIPLANAVQVFSLAARNAAMGGMTLAGFSGGSLGTLDTSADAFTIEPRVWSTTGLSDDTFRFGASCTLTRTN
jgi:hypothetical protein